MCAGSPNIPKTPPPPQEQKQPDTAQLRKRRQSGMGGGTLLTGPSGVANSTLNTGATTLLGG